MGRRIAMARERAGLTQAALASTISLDRSALAKIEGGSRRVSALELARIAEAVDERIEWFVFETPAAIVSYRSSGASWEIPEVDRLIERTAWNVEFAAQNDDRFSLTSLAPLDRPRNRTDVEHSAIDARRLLELDQQEPLFGLPEKFAKIGLLSFSIDMGENAADAASIPLSAGGVAIVNGHLRVGRRRLALAHELGHYLFSDEYTVDWRVSQKDDEHAWESRVDRFARALLLPENGVRPLWTSLHGSGASLRTSAVTMASKFRVDMSTLAQRLRELGLISASDYAQVLTFRTKRADIVELDLVTSDELAPPLLPRAYEESIVRLYRQEVVSPARAIDLLFDTWNEDDLPELPELPESSIWDFV